MADALYDRIGAGYATYRVPDARIQAMVDAGLGDARTVLNVGAGTGSYEPPDRDLVALEPSAQMRAQRTAGAAPCVAGIAEALPFADDAFDAAMVVLSLHHWTDQRAGLSELRRVARRQVVMTFVNEGAHDFWLFRDYLPEILDLPANFPLPPTQVAELLGGGEVHVVPVPWDCTDGFLTAHWRRPERYLDPGARAATSGFSLLPADLVDERIARLAADLESGAWTERNADLLELDSIDLGYRLVVAEGESSASPGVSASTG